MKNTIKLTLALALFAGMAMADDGNQGTGGRTCNPLTDPTCHTGAMQTADENELGGEVSIGGQGSIGGLVIGVIEESTLFLLG